MPRQNSCEIEQKVLNHNFINVVLIIYKLCTTNPDIYPHLCQAALGRLNLTVMAVSYLINVNKYKTCIGIRIKTTPTRLYIDQKTFRKCFTYFLLLNQSQN